MKKLLILRGIPGSGKSTYAHSFKNATVVSADDFFLSPTGEYLYDREKIQLAHEVCYMKFVKAVTSGDETIIVDNMNIEAWEISPYLMFGRMFDYEVEIVNFLTDLETSINRNIHLVPRKDVESAAARMIAVKLPRHFKQVSAKSR